MYVIQLALAWVGWPNGEKLTLTCVQTWSRPKWAQFVASQRKCTQFLATELQVDPSSQLASICDSVQTESQVHASWKLGVASTRKLKTWVHLRLRLARPCVDLRRLAMACAHPMHATQCTQVKASFSPFGHPNQVNASWMSSINLLLANVIEPSLP